MCIRDRFCVSLSRLPRRELPRRELPRPILTTTGYHACVYIPVITPELSRSTTHVHRVITPAISNSYFAVYLLPFTPPVLLHLHHHRAPHVPTYSTVRHRFSDCKICCCGCSQLIPVFSSSSFKHDAFSMYPLAVLSHLQRRGVHL